MQGRYVENSTFREKSLKSLNRIDFMTVYFVRIYKQVKSDKQSIFPGDEGVPF